MRGKRQEQVPLIPAAHEHRHAKELDAMDIITRDEPSILDLALGLCDEAPKRSTLQENIKKISASTWEEINQVLVAYA